VQFLQSPAFEVALPLDNVYNFAFNNMPCASTDPHLYLDAGIYSPSIDTGYYVQLEPLSDGIHTLHIHAENPAFQPPPPQPPFSIDVTYTLTVVQVSKK
jgi:hypothetical protein